MATEPQMQLLYPSYGASGSKARRITWETIAILDRERERASLRSRRSFVRVVIKWPFKYDVAGRPLSPGSSRRVVGPSYPALPNGTIKTEFTCSLVFRALSETIKTQWRAGGSPMLAVQISPRMGTGTTRRVAGWLLVKINLIRRVR